MQLTRNHRVFVFIAIAFIMSWLILTSHISKVQIKDYGTVTVIRGQSIDIVLDIFNLSGAAFPWFIVVDNNKSIDDAEVRATISHEATHQAQMKRLSYIWFPFEYLNQVLYYGYDKAPLEVEAREYALIEYWRCSTPEGYYKP